MKIIFLTLSLLLPVSAFADKLLVANCSEGEGCTFELTEFENDLFETDGRDIGPDDIYVIGKTKDGKIIDYIDSKSREEIDKDWGGDGYTQVGIFNPHIQPLSGLWAATYGTATGNDCYGIGNIGAFFRNKITKGTAGKGNINFQYPFNPAQLFPSGEMKWIKTGYNTYKGLLDMGGDNQAGMKMYYHITILNTKRIETVYTTEIKVPAKGTCIGKLPVIFTFVKGYELEDALGNDPLEDDLMEVKSRGNKDDLMEVRTRGDDLLPVETDKKPRPKIDIIDQSKVDMIQD